MLGPWGWSLSRPAAEPSGGAAGWDGAICPARLPAPFLSPASQARRPGPHRLRRVGRGSACARAGGELLASLTWSGQPWVEKAGSVWRVVAGCQVGLRFRRNERAGPLARRPIENRGRIPCWQTNVGQGRDRAVLAPTFGPQPPGRRGRALAYRARFVTPQAPEPIPRSIRNQLDGETDELRCPLPLSPHPVVAARPRPASRCGSRSLSVRSSLAASRGRESRPC